MKDFRISVEKKNKGTVKISLRNKAGQNKSITLHHRSTWKFPSDATRLTPVPYKIPVFHPFLHSDKTTVEVVENTPKFRMTVYGHGGVAFLSSQPSAANAVTGAVFKQVFPVDYEAEVSQRLVEASHSGDILSVTECLSDPYVDVNFSGVVWLRMRMTEVVLHEEKPNEVRFEYEELRTEVSALFLASHNGNRDLVRKLLNSGADVNQKLFWGFATTAAVREGRADILQLLVKSGASQKACEEALLEACCHNKPELVELLMASEFIRYQTACHALVLACTRGFVDVIDALLKYRVDPNAMTRILLRSIKPTLHTNVDCTALVAAVIGRHVPVVSRLLQAGVDVDKKVSLGAWSWDTNTGEEHRVGAGLSDPYSSIWCAVEYFECTGYILRMLLQLHSVNAFHRGRTLLHHAILCSNPAAVSVLLDAGADIELAVMTSGVVTFRPIHMAITLRSCSILRILVESGCEIDSRTDSGETAAMLCAKYKLEDCLKVLLIAGADLGLLNSCGASTFSIAISNGWTAGFQRSVLEVMRARRMIYSSNNSVFFPLLFASRCGDLKALEPLLTMPDLDLNQQDDNGYSAVMVAAKEGHIEAFRSLVFAGVNVNLRNNFGETAITISQQNMKNKDLFEKVMLEYALDKGTADGFYALHYAARNGDDAAVRLLTSRGCNVNVLDEEDYTPLMLAAREGHGEICSLLISSGARCDIKTSRGETALSLARRMMASNCVDDGSVNSAEQVILDELSRVLVRSGCKVKKHTKGGKGLPHEKMLRMVEGLLQWGRSSRRNVLCKEVEVGPSSVFQRRRRGKADACEPGIFRVVTIKNIEVHFVCEGGVETAELWVRGIRLLTREAARMTTSA